MKRVIAFAVVSLVITGFIWGNSMTPPELSRTQSTQIAQTLQPVLDSGKEIKEWKFHDFIRKFAHMAEFFLLGLAVAGFGVSLSACLKRNLISLPILMVILVAVADEFIQHFTYRGSLVTDVVLDFVSSVVGLGLVWLIVYVWLFVNRRRMTVGENTNG